jgi:hypothetical protein
MIVELENCVGELSYEVQVCDARMINRNTNGDYII